MDDCSVLRINFRFANDVHYHQLPLAVPCTVGDVRDHLKSTLNITTPLDVVVYSVSVETDTENSILFDSERLLGGARYLVKRVPESLAKILLQHATIQHGETSTLSGTISKNSSLVREEVIGNAYTNSVIFPKRTGNDLSETAKFTRLPFNNKRIKMVPTTSVHETIETETLELKGSDVTLNTNDNYCESKSDASLFDGKSICPKTLSVSNNILKTENSQTQDAGLNALRLFETAAQGQGSCNEVIGQGMSDKDDEDEEDERERILLRKVAEEHENHLGPCTKSVITRKAFNSGEKNYFQEKFNRSSAIRNHRGYSGKRFFRNCNLTWTNQNEEKLTAESCSTSVPFSLNRNGGRQVNALKSNNFFLPKAIIPVNENYLCHICGEKGHHIRNCVKGNDPKQQKKVKPATGVPRSWLRRIPEDQVAVVNGDVYCLPDGTFAVLKNFFTISKSKDACVDFDKKIQERYGVGVGSDIRNHLHCSLCGQVFNKPVLTACCGETFCEPCILSRLNASSRNKTCPSCYEEINPSDLFLNKVIQDSVNAIRGVVSVSSERSQDSPVNEVQVEKPEGVYLLEDHHSSVQWPTPQNSCDVNRDPLLYHRQISPLSHMLNSNARLQRKQSSCFDGNFPNNAKQQN